eukprot:1065670-Amphidinium_carterae.1
MALTLRRVCCLVFGVLGGGGGGSTPLLPEVGDGAMAVVTKVESKKFKLLSVLDQTDDSEVGLLETSKLQELIKAWKLTHDDNENPESDLEASGEQLSVLSARLAAGLTP